MQNLLSITDGAQKHLVIFMLEEEFVQHSAADVLLELLGVDDAAELVERNILAEGYVDDLKVLQGLIFDQDAQGKFIRENITFNANGKELNPDAPMESAFIASMKGNVPYKRCDVIVLTVGEEAPADHDIRDFSLAYFLHQLSVAAPIDVTKDYPELMDTLGRAEKDGLVEVDVKAASYKLTERGKKIHSAYLEEAQDLIKRFDIFADVDVDSSGTARFDTGLGRDLRVPVYESEGVDPFRARFLLGLNDGEWDKAENWIDSVENPKFFDRIMEPVEQAPSIDEIGRNRLESVIEQGKAILRTDSQFR